jgi:hypothetical protein
LEKFLQGDAASMDKMIDAVAEHMREVKAEARKAELEKL